MKPTIRKPLLICLAVLVLVAVAVGSFGAGWWLRPRVEAEPPTATDAPTSTTEPPTVIEAPSGEILETFHLPKVPMEHNGTLGFSWTAERVFGARVTDYLAPQMQEIFEMVGYESSGEYYVADDNAGWAANQFVRCIIATDKNKRSNCLALLCSATTSISGDEVCLNVQIINPAVIPFNTLSEGINYFSTADFDGDGKDEIISESWNLGTSAEFVTVGIFPFTDKVWNAPLFWATNGGENPLRYDLDWGIRYYFGFELKDNDDKSWTVSNSITGYSRKIPGDTYLVNGSMDHCSFGKMQIVDVDNDGVYELILWQEMHHYAGDLVSLLKYDTKMAAFQTLYAECRLFDDEKWDWDAPMNENYYGFLTRAGYDPDKAIFKDYR